MPILTVAESIREAQEQLLAESENVFLIGEGVNDQGAFGTTAGLKAKFPGRVLEMPVSEGGMTGVCIGAAISGLRPIMIHMRADFLLYAADQIINNAAKWWSMFGGRAGSVPLVIRAIIGRGWGQGIQHSQHLERMFSGVQGLTVVCPSNAYDAKGALIWASRQNRPVLFFEHRWIHELKCEVPKEMYEVPPTSKFLRRGKDDAVMAWGYMVHECMKAADLLAKQGIDISVIDTMGPCRQSGGLVIEEQSCCPPSFELSKGFYPDVAQIMSGVGERMKVGIDLSEANAYVNSRIHDIPDKSFRGPF